MIGLLVRLDARRPASWIAAVVAFVAISWVLVRPAPAWVAAVCGCLAAVAAMGVPGCLTGIPDVAVTRAVARVAWPVLAIAAAGASAHWFAVDPSHRATSVVAAVLGSAMPVVAAVPAIGRLGRRIVAAGVDQGMARAWIDAVAMASVLVAMAVCYFLAPHLAGWYAVVAGVWFVGVVVPRSVLDGMDAEARRMLAASAVGTPRLPGSPGHAGRMLATGAAILGWPALVAGVLWSGPTWATSSPAAAVALLVMLAGVAAVAMRFTRRPGDTPLAVAAGMLALAVARFAQAP